MDANDILVVVYTVVAGVKGDDTTIEGKW